MTVRILVVDDEPDLQDLIRQRFRKQIREKTYQFLFAENGEAALAMLEQEPECELVLTDLNMPVMDGLTLLREVSKLQRLLKAVVISAYGDMENIRTAMNYGAFDFITKPIDFQDLEITVQKTLDEIKALKAGQRAQQELLLVEKELDVAAQIQQAMLPKTFPPFPERPEIELFASMRPARQVGGDFYDFFFIDSYRLAFVIGDVSGKGVPAAIFMAVTASMLKAAARRTESPSDCVLQVNELLFEENTASIFVTMIYGIIDTRSGVVSYTNAGHNLPYHFRAKDGALAPFENQGGMVVGLFQGTPYTVSDIQLAPGDFVYLYTDGVTEAMSPTRELFGEERLKETLLAVAKAPLNDVCMRVLEETAHFAQGEAQRDDITMLAVRYTGESHSTLES